MDGFNVAEPVSVRNKSYSKQRIIKFKASSMYIN